MELPKWFYEAGLSETVFTLGLIFAIVTGAGVVTVKLWKFFSPLFLDVRQFLVGWNGAPAVTDNSGGIIEPAKIGIKADVQAIKVQLENDHAPVNLRHDIDTKATKLQVEELSREVRTLGVSLRRHIDLSIEREQYEDTTLNLFQLYLPALKKIAEEMPNGTVE